MWRDTARALGLDPTPGAFDQPVVRIVKEKRAPLAHTPAALRLRPGVRTRWSNLALAGDGSEVHSSELQSLMRISYVTFCLRQDQANKKYVVMMCVDITPTALVIHR